MSIKRAALAGAGLLAVLALAGTGSPIGAQTSRAHHYRVTLVNLTNGQPFSPPAAATHGESMHMFQVGEMATIALSRICLPSLPTSLGHTRVLNQKIAVAGAFAMV